MSLIDNPVTAPEGTPIGGCVVWFTGTAPTGWLICDGSAFSGATYPALATLLGGTTLPDLRDVFPLGAGTHALGATGGALGHTHTQPTHTHTGPSHTHTQPTHTHTQPTHTHTGPSHTHDVDIPPFTSGGPSATTPTQLILGAVASSAHTHSINPPNTTSTAAGTGATGASGGDATGAAGDDATGAAGTGATGASGGDATGANDPPFRAVHFIIRAA